MADADHSLVMPFLPVTSKGGPYDDEGYAAGWEMGMLDTRLAAGGADTVVATVLSTNAAQVDLLAMRHGWTATVIPTDVDGWSLATIRPPAADDELWGPAGGWHG